MFEGKIGKSMEVYIDSMLVKSLWAKDHLKHLPETFDILKKYNTMLYPENYAFGVGSGKFLEFMVSNRGININPDKIKTIEDITVVDNIKVIQRLSRCIAVLAWLISMSFDKRNQFFSLLKKKNNLSWNQNDNKLLKNSKSTYRVHPCYTLQRQTNRYTSTWMFLRWR